jgi:hypothetical protein
VAEVDLFSPGNIARGDTMSQATIIIGLTACLLFPGTTMAGFFGPSTFEECIDESMKGVGSDVAARALYANCKKKFPTEEEKARIEKDKADKKADDIKKCETLKTLYQNSLSLQYEHGSLEKYLKTKGCGAG